MSYATITDSRAKSGGGLDHLGEDAVRWITAIERWTDYMLAAGYTAATVRQRLYQVRRVAESDLRRSPWRVTTAELMQWMARQDWAPESHRQYGSALRSFYGWAVKSGYTKRNPAADLPRVRPAKTTPRPAPDAVTAVAFASASDRDRLILYLAAYAGLRRAEIAALRWTDVTPNGLWIKGKGNRERVVPLHRELRRELAEEWRRRERGQFGTGYRYRTCFCGCIFPGQSGRPMTPNGIGQAASKVLGAGYGAHSLRHRFATRAYASGRDLFAVQALLGHSKPETTLRYTQLVDGSLAAAVNSI